MTAPAALLQSDSQERKFFGEPRALAYLAFTETWERSAYYGMTALFVLYLSQALLTPGYMEHVVGLTALRRGIEAALGPMTALALASQVFGLYTGFAYFTPVFGGWIADRWIGRRNAVMLGAVLMSGGHLAMVFDRSILLALALLILGCGLLKGNISTQVGSLYAEDDSAGRTRGFSIFSMGINAGAVSGPLLCGLLAQVYGWHAGSGLASALMLLGLATYLTGYRHLSSASRHAPNRAAASLDRKQVRILAGLGTVIGISAFQSVAYLQELNIGLIWISKNVDLDIRSYRIPAPWFASADPLMSIVAVPPLLALWRYQAKRGGEPGEIAKMATGAWLAALANLWLAIACMLFSRMSLLVPVVYISLLAIAFLYYWPTLLALVSRAAPSHLKATLMGVAFLSLFLSNISIGWLGTLYERMGAAAFWTMHAGIAATGGALAMLLRRRLEGLFTEA